jgi:predicted SPOUT superfamily RNA methylase MTH1
MTKDLSIALPDSLLSDCGHIRDKTVKIGNIARSCAIFRINTIYLYRDISNRKSEFELIKMLFEFLDTPQYLRRLLFVKREELRYAGLLPPLRTPHHKLDQNLSEIKHGDLREGVIIRKSSKLFVNVGLSKLIPLKGSAKDRTRVTVKFIRAYPALLCEIVSPREIKDYWGYKIVRLSSLRDLLKKVKPELLLITSRQGQLLTEIWKDIFYKIQNSHSTCIVFGSPKSGVHEIIKLEGLPLKNISDYIINTFPKQGSQTIRTDEAIMGTLALLNFMIFLKD